MAQQTKIDRLEDNLQTVFHRINNSNEDFTDEEIAEMKYTLKNMDLNDILNIDESWFSDLLFVDDDEEETIVDLDKQNALRSKLEFPTLKMQATYKDLIDSEINLIKQFVS